jgi:hypothetical protein
MDAGKIHEGSIVVVDRNSAPRASLEFRGEHRVRTVMADWSEYLADYFLHASVGREDQLIPAHIAPHLLFDLCARYLRSRGISQIESLPVTAEFGLPFEKLSGGMRFISAAAWLCPFSCIEPSVCPAIKSERTWDLSTLVPRIMSNLADRVVVFKTTHYAWGVGSISSAHIASSLSSLADEVQSLHESEMNIVVATTSNCHGVVGMLRAHKPPPSGYR